LTDQFWA